MDNKAIAFVRRYCIERYLTVFNSSSFAATSLYNDLRHKEKYRVKRGYLLSLQFGISKGLEKIRRVFVSDQVRQTERKTVNLKPTERRQAAQLSV